MNLGLNDNINVKKKVADSDPGHFVSRRSESVYVKFLLKCNLNKKNMLKLKECTFNCTMLR